MIIGGLQKFSLIDYPKHLSAIIFTQGCNFKCQFCYNPMLVWPSVSKSKQKDHYPQIKEDDLFAFLKSRVGKLEAVVITGGEPTLHKDLSVFMAKIKKLNYLIKLDTNGSKPEMLQDLINKRLVDYIALDIKAPEAKYKKVIGGPADFKKIKKSVKIIMENGLPHEFRTTIVPSLLNKGDIIKIAKIIKGARAWYLQQFKLDVDLVNNKLKGIKPFTVKDMEEMRRLAGRYVKKCKIR